MKLSEVAKADSVVVVKAPEKIPDSNAHTVFLAGSIEMNKAEDWQTTFTNAMAGHNVMVLNPRRDDWDSSWKQEASDPQFKKQVTWELDSQDAADTIVMYFDPSTKSPISLLELGLFAGTGKMLVCCPEGFWRKGNVDIVCKRYKIPMYDSLDKLIKAYLRGIS